MPSDWYDHTPVTEAPPDAAERPDPSSEELDAEPREDQDDYCDFEGWRDEGFGV